jgi:uncharacterized repeat protein (TIGR01451 family)
MATRVITAGKMRAGDAIAVAALLCAFIPCPALAATTQAGTGIVNTARLSYDINGAPQSQPSNTVSLTAAEILDVSVVADRDSVAVSTSSAPAIGFVVTNNGNGTEGYAIAAASDRAGVAATRIAIDSDNDGKYDPATDQLLAAGTPLILSAAQQQRLFVLVEVTQVVATTRLSLTATARTGSGQPGTIFAGAGAQGSDAVVGRTGATAGAATTLTVSSALPTLAKSQTVFAPDGSSRPVRGAIVTYRLVASFPAATLGVTIDDPIPAGTDYVPGSMTLDDRALTDAVDGDLGTADTQGIHVALGNVSSAGTRTIQFSVKIQ